MSLILAAHMVLFVVAYVGAFLLRFDLSIPEHYAPVVKSTVGLIVGVKILVFYAAGQYAGWWRYVGLKDIVAVTKAAALSTLVFVAINFIFLESRQFPRSIYLLDFILTVAVLGSVRVSVRLLREALLERSKGGNKNIERLLIIGAGDTCETLLREIDKNSNLQFRAVALLDDDHRKQGLRIHHVPVVGTIDDLTSAVETYDVGEIIIATPSASPTQLRRIMSKCQESGIKPKILPSVERVLKGNINLGALREVAIEDLLGRKEIKLDQVAIAAYCAGKTVLVTGAGGSIGSEICRQVSRFAPKRLLMLEQAENPLFFIERELRVTFDGAIELVPIIADVCEHKRIEAIFEEYRPEVVLHAAAHKHVPLMEANPGEAVRNNFLGTRNVARAAAAFGSHSFVMISTDKAINPTSVMGTTKRLAELYVQGMARKHEGTQFIAVRFGNVLGSNGSVIPIFREQIRKGGPVTVTHPEMQRYFMTIPEATQLVLQAATRGASGQVFVLDMGVPVKILDLARDLIRLSGLRPGEDVEIVFTGIRPGEKLFEELSQDEESISKTDHEKIYIGNVSRLELDLLEREVPTFLSLIDGGTPEAIKTQLKHLVPEYVYIPPLAEAGPDHVEEKIITLTRS
jgi:FlaA1/EpsC-like NDP-sugar epimerase